MPPFNDRTTDESQGGDGTDAFARPDEKADGTGKSYKFVDRKVCCCLPFAGDATLIFKIFIHDSFQKKLSLAKNAAF